MRMEVNVGCCTRINALLGHVNGHAFILMLRKDVSLSLSISLAVSL